ncbi:MAG: helix-turn-helix domain-containing protein [Myxococcota bacterium]
MREDRLTIEYAGEDLGALHVHWKQASDDSHRSTRGRHFTQDLALLVSRDRAQRWSHETFGEEHAFVGLSSSLRLVEQQVERMSHTRLPVMIRGECGTESLTAAVALHCGGPQRLADFVAIHCATADAATIAKQLGNALQSEKTGTVFLYGIDDLSATAQREVLDNIPLAMSSPVAVAKAGPRLIASTARDLARYSSEGLFSRTLLAELDVLSLAIPPLRERTEDIPVLTRHILRQLRGDSDAPGRGTKTCHGDVIEIMSQYPWPGNLVEFKRVLLQLAIMSKGDTIQRRDVLLHAPQLLRGPPAHPHDAKSQALLAPRRPQSLEEWVEAISNEDFERFDSVHEGLHRALVYMSKHYQQRLSLRELSRRAHLSTSHLSYLFKSSVGTNFKTLLARLRIEKAKTLLTPNGRQRRITDVAAESGFGDLSHFEKTFRRFVHMCPSEYRQSLSARP